MAKNNEKDQQTTLHKTQHRILRTEQHESHKDIQGDHRCFGVGGQWNLIHLPFEP